MRKIGLLLSTVLLAAGLATAAGCGDGEDAGDGDEQEAPTATAVEGGTSEANLVDVVLAEYAVQPNVDSVRAGSVTFSIRDLGGNQHELIVVRTDLGPDELPVHEDGSFNEADAGVQVAGRIDPLPAFEGAATLTLDLEPGPYVLLCNIVDQSGSHFDLGMRTAFQVTQ
jgi:hypothetical protein